MERFPSTSTTYFAKSFILKHTICFASTRKSLPSILLACAGLAACNDNISTEISPNNKTYGDFVISNQDVYCDTQLIPQANASQFNYLGSQYINYETIHYAKDNTHVYTCDVRRPTIINPAKPYEVIMKTLEDIDSDSFMLLDDGYAKDTKTVLYGNEKVAGANADNLKILKNSYQTYAFDGKHIFYGSKRLPVKYPRNFRLLGGIFATDNYHVYADRTRLNIDPHRAVVMTYRHIRDDKNVYYLNKQIKGAHACSFAPGGETEDSMDKDHFYYLDERWELDKNSTQHQLRRLAHEKWKAYYAKFRSVNKKGCPTKRVLIPRHQDEINIVDIHSVD